MKKYLLIVATLFVFTGLFAKKVKFAVNMWGTPVDTLGIHVTGDFQTAAGYAGGDWMPNTTPMTQEISDTNIYSIIVDIPAFTKYEFKFVNGIYAYQVEFVPIESRVLYNFIDNRWIYIDSLANDTTIIEPVLFQGNAPKGKYLLRFEVDMQNESGVNSNGVHIEGGFNNWSTVQTRMYSFDGNVYEYITYVDTLNVAIQNEFKYINGNILANTEQIPGWCVNANNNRSMYLPKDSILPIVCFAACSDCQSVGLSENLFTNGISAFPNPSTDFMILQFNDNTNLHSIVISDVNGKVVKNIENYNGSYLRLGKTDFASGIYFGQVIDHNGSITSLKFIFN